MKATLYVLLSALLTFAYGAAFSGTSGLHARDAPFEEVRTRLWRNYNDPEVDQPEKYFHEASFHQHYDGRFGGRTLRQDERMSHLRALIQSYLSSMDDIGVETWIMHGTLLGWYWNRQIMPWDTDLDVMVSERSIHHLADYYNMTYHRYHLPDMGSGRDYLLEINPHYASDEVDGANRIDARWIDTETGLFIDITTLRRNKTAQASGEPDAMMAKDKHHYLYDEIYPLRFSSFEGAPVKVPFAYPELLIEEYSEKALAYIFYADHRFEPERLIWKPIRYSDRHGLSGLSRDTSYWGMRLPSLPG